MRHCRKVSWPEDVVATGIETTGIVILKVMFSSIEWKQVMHSFCQRAAIKVTTKTASKTSLGLLQRSRIGKLTTSRRNSLSWWTKTYTVRGIWRIPPTGPSSRSSAHVSSVGVGCYSISVVIVEVGSRIR